MASRNRVGIIQTKLIMRSIKKSLRGVKVHCHEVAPFKNQWKNRNNT